MALTPEDVVNKRFQPTKFREGYDQDEVDDFLDEVVVELRRLVQENEELRQRIVASDARISELQRSGGSAASAAESAPAAPAPAAAVPATPVAAAPAAQPAEEFDEAGSSSNLLQLARRLHEEHVREGVQKRDALIAEGHAAAARLVGEAEVKQREQVEILEKQRAALETKVEELRTFERDYRQTLKNYIQGQLHELETTSPTATETPRSDAPAGAAGFSGFAGN